MTVVWAGYDMTPSLDGPVAVAALDCGDCCPDPLCVGFCDIACSFIDLLPTGPMWDRPKAEAMRFYSENNGTDPCQPACALTVECHTIVQHSIYMAGVLAHLITNALWPAIRESNPATAVTTLDDWLARYQWQDCFLSMCRSPVLGEVTPYEYMSECGPILCPPPSFPDDLDCAIKRAIVLALRRLSRGVIKNLDGINWVIAPLGAVLRPDLPGGHDPDVCAAPPQFEICNDGETIEACPPVTAVCGPAGGELRRISASFSYRCDGIMRTVWPAVMAAECIVRSMLPQQCPNIINRCAGIDPHAA